MLIARSCVLAAALVALVAPPRAEAAGPALTEQAIDAAPFTPLPDPPAKTPSPEVVKAEVLLDRARFSPGAIDGIDGDNFRKAIGAYQAARKLPATGRLDQATWSALTSADNAPVLAVHTITKAETRGPFAKTIPVKFEQQAALKRLAYRDVLEELSEQVHASPSLLRALNPGVGWQRPGTRVTVPQVVVERAKSQVARIVVDKPGHAVEAYGPDGGLLAYYPASIGSAEKPAPSGQFVVRHVVHNPDYTYNPKYAFKGVTASKPFTIAPGPNNPVGSVWIDLSDEGYGIHGTPEPDLVGKTQSHGCIRLTNWDAEDLASMVPAGIPVVFQDAGPASPATPSPPVSAPATSALGPAMPASSTTAPDAPHPPEPASTP